MHELTYGWTEPIRKGMEEVAGYLRELGELEYSSVDLLERSVVFEAPPQVERFAEELARVPVEELAMDLL